jgi:hypothetical protein
VLRWVIAFIVLGLLAAAYPPASRLVKRFQAQRLTAQALNLIEHQQWPDAAKKIRNAFQLRPTDVEIWRANARLLSRTHRGASAIEWWSKIAQSRALSLQDRRDCAAAALSTNDLALASEQINLILAQQDAPTPIDLLLVGQLAVLRGDNTAALDSAKRAAADSRSGLSELLRTNLLILLATAQNSPDFVVASSQLVQMARNPADSVSLEALTVLARQLSAARPSEDADQPLSIPLPKFSTTNISALEIADRLEQHPSSRGYHKMLALEMRARAQPAREDELIARAIQSYGPSDDETVAALGAWLYTRGRFLSMLEIVPLERAALSRDLLLERIDALAALGRLSELKEMLLTEYPVLPQSYQHMYLAVVRSRLAEAAATVNEWERAVDAADTVQSLLALAEYAEKNGRLDVAEAAYAQTIRKQPELRSSYAARLRLLEAMGQTGNAHQLALEMAQVWPDDVGTHFHEIYLRLLQGASASEVKAAEKEAEASISKNPWDGIARSTLALARLKLGRAAAALEVLSDPNTDIPASSISWPVYVAALAANGWKDKAREEALKITAVTILPEERALFAPLLETQ